MYLGKRDETGGMEANRGGGLSQRALVMAAPALAGSIFYPNFSNTSGLQLNKSAKVSSDTIHLTEDGKQLKAGSFFTKRKFLRTDGSFTATFAFQITSSGEAADGFTFVVQSGKAKAIGEAGGGLGYSRIKKSFAVGFDTFIDDVVCLFKHGKTFNPIGEVTPSPGLVGGVRYGWVDYDAATHEIDVYYSDSQKKPADPIVEGNQDLSKLGEKARVGFTASTGSFTATHEIRDLSSARAL